MAAASVKRRLPASERRSGILQAASRVFAEQGYAAATTFSIAQRANVSEALLFRHFQSKEVLYGEVLRHLTTVQDARLARTAGFVLFNLRASWQVDARWQLYARVDNVFDRRYETYGQAGLNVFPGGTLLQPGAAVPIERFVAPGAPRLFLVGVRYEWGGR